MTKTEWNKLSKKEKLEYIYRIGIESTFSSSKSKARDKEFYKLLNWEIKGYK